MREQFPVFQAYPELVYFDSSATAHKPKSVIESLTQFYSVEYATVHRAVYGASLRATEKYHASREAARKFLHAAHVEEIIFTRGTTDGINLIAQLLSQNLQSGDEILVSEMEHHSNLVPWQMAAQRTGATLKHIPIDQEGVLQWERMIHSKTKIVALAHVSNVTGTINPIAKIAQASHAVGAIFVVDGAQGAPHMPVDVMQLGCDFYAFSGHKCYGPTGVGVLYGKRHLLEQMPPIQGGGDMIVSVGLQQSSYADCPLRFEAGTPPIASVIALKAALEFMEQVGCEKIFEHGQVLLRYASDRLRSIPGLLILGAANEKAPIVTFHIEGVHPLDLATFLDAKHIAIRSGHLCAQPLLHAFGLKAAARASFGIYNTLDEVDRFVAAVCKIVQMFKRISS